LTNYNKISKGFYSFFPWYLYYNEILIVCVRLD
jgi:hypothetical protein